MLLFWVLAAVPALAGGLESVCFQETFPSVRIGVSSIRKEAIEACSQLVIADPSDPRPYYHRALARYLGPSAAQGWNEPPHFDLRVSEEPGPVIYDLETALARAALALESSSRPVPRASLASARGEGREFPAVLDAWLKLGYLHASRGAWPAALRAWTEAARGEETRSEALRRLRFVRERLVAPDRLSDVLPTACETLSIWDCILVRGCAPARGPNTGGASGELAYLGCRGKPGGMRVGPSKYECADLDEDTCELSGRCRWKGGLFRAKRCATQ